MSLLDRFSLDSRKRKRAELNHINRQIQNRHLDEEIARADKRLTTEYPIQPANHTHDTTACRICRLNNR